MRCSHAFIIAMVGAATILLIGRIHEPSPEEPRVLRLRGQDATEDVLRRAFIATLAADPDAGLGTCHMVRAAPNLEAALRRMGNARRPEERLQPDHPDYIQPRIMDGAVARPGQTGRHQDKLRMAEILIEICKDWA